MLFSLNSIRSMQYSCVLVVRNLKSSLFDLSPFFFFINIFLHIFRFSFIIKNENFESENFSNLVHFRRTNTVFYNCVRAKLVLYKNLHILKLLFVFPNKSDNSCIFVNSSFMKNRVKVNQNPKTDPFYIFIRIISHFYL